MYELTIPRSMTIKLFNSHWLHWCSFLPCMANFLYQSSTLYSSILEDDKVSIHKEPSDKLNKGQKKNAISTKWENPSYNLFLWPYFVPCIRQVKTLNTIFRQSFIKIRITECQQDKLTNFTIPRQAHRWTNYYWKIHFSPEFHVLPLTLSDTQLQSNLSATTLMPCICFIFKFEMFWHQKYLY